MNLLITGAMPLTQVQIQQLEAAGHVVYLLAEEGGALPLSPAEVEGVVANDLFAHHPVEGFSRLRYVQLTSAGADRAPLEALARAGVTVRTAVGVYAVPMAEHILWMVLSVLRRGGFFLVGQSARRWEKRRDLRELCGRRVCVLGCGAVGNACAERFSALGCEVHGLARAARADARYAAVRALGEPGALEEELAVADIVLLALPLAPETRHILGARELGLLRSGALLVNPARGALVDTAALTDVLAAGRIEAALDVLEEEPLPADSPLWGLPNVLLTPHNSFVGEGNSRRLWALVWENLEAFCGH